MRVAALALLVVGALSTAGTNPAHAQTAAERFVPGEVLVKFEPGTTGEERAAAHRQNDAEVEEIIPDLGVRVVEVPAGQEKSAVAAYERNPNVSYAELNTIVRVADQGDPQDPRLVEQWQYHNTVFDNTTGQWKDAPDIDALEAWRVTRGSNDVAIAILDSGIDQSHEDIQNETLQIKKIVQNRNFTRSKTVDDKVGHGTHVAGSAAAITDSDAITDDQIGVAGTCPDCVLYNGKVVGNDGSGRLSWLVKAILWAANPDGDPNTADGAEVISMSLGTSTGSRALRAAVDKAWSEGAVLVAAAGNYGGKKPFFPAYYSNVIAVAATNDNDAKPAYSNYGDWVDVAAPGGTRLAPILSTAPDHPSLYWRKGIKYGKLYGTSMATPHVAGVAGLVWAAKDSSGAANLCSTNECVRNRIQDTADPIAGTGSLWVYGRINAYNAVTPSQPSGS